MHFKYIAITFATYAITNVLAAPLASPNSDVTGLRVRAEEAPQAQQDANAQLNNDNAKKDGQHYSDIAKEPADNAQNQVEKQENPPVYNAQAQPETTEQTTNAQPNDQNDDHYSAIYQDTKDQDKSQVNEDDILPPTPQVKQPAERLQADQPVENQANTQQQQTAPAAYEAQPQDQTQADTQQDQPAPADYALPPQPQGQGQGQAQQHQEAPPSYTGQGQPQPKANSQQHHTASPSYQDQGQQWGAAWTVSDCDYHGEFLCNGRDLYGICNWGQVIWQPVALGTACVNGGIGYARRMRI